MSSQGLRPDTSIEQGSLMLSILNPQDLTCSICLSLLNDPFVTSCGHTFCYGCISTHLQSSKNCPSCSGFLSKELIYPNFLLVKVAKAAQLNAIDDKISTFEAVQRTVTAAKGRLTPSEIDTLIQTLSQLKQDAERVDQKANMELLLHFLHHSREEKIRKLEALQKELQCLDTDITKVEVTTQTTLGGGGGGASGFTTTAAGTIPFEEEKQRYLQQQSQQTQQQQLETGTSDDRDVKPTTLSSLWQQQQQQQLATTSSDQHQHHPSMHGMQQAALVMAQIQQGSSPQRNVSHAVGSRLPVTGATSNLIAAGGGGGHSNNTNVHSFADARLPGIEVNPNLHAAAHAILGGCMMNAPSDQQHQQQQEVNSDAGGVRNMLGLLKNKKRKIASQFDDLQSAYLRLRANRLSASSHDMNALAGAGGGGGAGGGHANGSDIRNNNESEVPARPGSSTALTTPGHGKNNNTTNINTDKTVSPPEGAVPSNNTHKVGALVIDEGLHEFSRMLAVLTRCSQLKVLAEIPRPSLRQSSSIISSIDFDRDGVLFATAGVSKRISIFEHAAVVGNTGVSVHCPVVELVTRSKLSCLSWNKYIASQVASSDYEGVITLWDVHSSTMMQEYEAHTKRIWSVDFCDADPTLLASGSDDCAVKLWSTRASCCVAQLDLKANVCSVAWRPGSQHELAVGSADHAVYLYDMRKASQPVRTYVGHRKAVSYVKWCDDEQLASASTDSTLRLWNRAGPIEAAAERVYEGHANEKNFVGMAADGDFLACGSETNEAFVYYRALSKPIARQGFGPFVPGGGDVGGDIGGGGNGGGLPSLLLGGNMSASARHGSVGVVNGVGGATTAAGYQPSEADKAAFISAVCWRPRTQELLVANSQGTVRVMQLTSSN